MKHESKKYSNFDFNTFMSVLANFLAYVEWAVKAPAFPNFKLLSNMSDKLNKLKVAVIEAKVSGDWKSAKALFEDVQLHFKRALASYAKSQVPNLCADLSEMYVKCNGNEKSLNDLRGHASKAVGDLEELCGKFFEPRDASEKYYQADAAIDAVYAEVKRIAIERKGQKLARRAENDAQARQLREARVKDETEKLFAGVESLKVGTHQ